MKSDNESNYQKTEAPLINETDNKPNTTIQDENHLKYLRRKNINKKILDAPIKNFNSLTDLEKTIFLNNQDHYIKEYIAEIQNKNSVIKEIKKNDFLFNNINNKSNCKYNLYKIIINCYFQF